jgi:hypothetical protein
LAAIKDDLTTVELMQKYDVHASQITDWKKQLLANAESTCVTSAERKAQDKGPDIKELQAKIGELTMDVDFLGGALDRMVDPRGRT